VSILPAAPYRCHRPRVSAFRKQGQALAAFTDGGADIEDLVRRARRQRLAVRVIRVPAVDNRRGGKS
jgi:hypothetical protein